MVIRALGPPAGGTAVLRGANALLPAGGDLVGAERAAPGDAPRATVVAARWSLSVQSAAVSVLASVPAAGIIEPTVMVQDSRSAVSGFIPAWI